jgi:hypothetical protein
MQHTILTLIALLALALTSCATQELRCDGPLEQINPAPSKAHAASVGDVHAR